MDVDARFPEVAPPSVPSRWEHAHTDQRAYVEYLLTAFARRALGARTEPVDQTVARAAVEAAYRDAFMTFGYGAGGSPRDGEYWKGVCTLLAAALSDPALVETCCGGKRLGAKVQRSKVYSKGGDHDLRGLGRHLATAARARLPARDVEAAMIALRDTFLTDGGVDLRVPLVAGYVWFAHVAAVHEVEQAVRSWLHGERLGVAVVDASQTVADGDDPRVRVFEQFAERLETARQVALLEFETSSDAQVRAEEARMFRPAYATHCAIGVFLARQTLPEGWVRRVDPLVAEWLGADVARAEITQRQAEERKKQRAVSGRREVAWSVRRGLAIYPAIRALYLEDAESLAAFTGGGELEAFRPGKLFKDDWRKLLRYVGAASAASARTKVARTDVEPAWFDFLSRKATEPLMEWSELLAIQAVITVKVGGDDARSVGRDLRQLLTGF
jgi:hypothetical protein